MLRRPYKLWNCTELDFLLAFFKESLVEECFHQFWGSVLTLGRVASCFLYVLKSFWSLRAASNMGLHFWIGFEGFHLWDLRISGLSGSWSRFIVLIASLDLVTSSDLKPSWFFSQNLIWVYKGTFDSHLVKSFHGSFFYFLSRSTLSSFGKNSWTDNESSPSDLHSSKIWAASPYSQWKLADPQHARCCLFPCSCSPHSSARTAQCQRVAWYPSFSRIEHGILATWGWRSRVFPSCL